MFAKSVVSSSLLALALAVSAAPVLAQGQPGPQPPAPAPTESGEAEALPVAEPAPTVAEPASVVAEPAAAEPVAAEPAPSESGPAIELPEIVDVGVATPQTSTAHQTQIGGYGELHFNRSMPEGGGDAESTLDLHRMVIFLGKQFSEQLRFYSEIEIEHALVGEGAPGEVEVEQAFVEYRLADDKSSMGEFGVRVGVILIPMGITNATHEPPTFHGVERPSVEKNVIPSTWWEGGAGVYGTVGPLPDLRYELYLVGGLNPLGFSAKSGIRSGRQKTAEARADGLALTGRLEYNLGTSTVLGGAGYFGLAGPNAGEVFDAAGSPVDIDVPVSGFAADARTKLSGIEAKALFAFFAVGDTTALADLRDEDGNDIGPAVGKKILGGYGEVAYDVLYTQETTHQLLPFARLEYYKTDPNDDTLAVTEVVLGLTYRPIPQVAFKSDFTMVRRGGGADGENILDLGVGFLY